MILPPPLPPCCRPTPSPTAPAPRLLGSRRRRLEAPATPPSLLAYVSGVFRFDALERALMAASLASVATRVVAGLDQDERPTVRPPATAIAIPTRRTS